MKDAVNTDQCANIRVKSQLARVNEISLAFQDKQNNRTIDAMMPKSNTVNATSREKSTQLKLVFFLIKLDNDG